MAENARERDIHRPPREKLVAADVLPKASEPARIFEEEPHTIVTVTEEEKHRIQHRSWSDSILVR